MSRRGPASIAASIVLMAGCTSAGMPWGKTAKSGPGTADAFAQQQPIDEPTRDRGRNAPAGRTPRGNAAAVADSADRNGQIDQLLATAAGHDEARNQSAARVAYERVLKLDPDHPGARYRLAVIADNEGRYDEAERHYRILLKHTPHDPDLLASLGWSYLLQRRYDESEQVLREGLRHDPRHQTALYNLGWLYGTLGDYDQALDIFRKAGSEDDAQRAISELFPRGRPAHVQHVTAGALRNPFSRGGETVAGTGRLKPLGPGRGTVESISAPAPWQNSGPGQNTGHSTAAWTESGRPGSRSALPGSAVAQHDSESLDQVFDALAAPTNGDPPLTSPGTTRPAGGLQPPPEEGAHRSDVPSMPIRQAGFDVSSQGDDRPGRPDAKSASAPTETAVAATGRSALPEWPYRPAPDASDSRQTGSPRQQARRDAARMALGAGPGGPPFPLNPPAGAARDSKR